MIKFFRKIRQKLLAENKFSKYLLYAIGEIALVMIGILLALQVNNWNEEKKSIRTSKVLLEEIVEDLKTDTVAFNSAYNAVLKQIGNEEWVLAKRDYEINQVEQLWDCFSGWYYDYYINERTFQKIQSDANTRIIGFDSIFKKITNYYKVHNNRVKAHVKWDIVEVTERQQYMKDLESDIEIDNYRIQTLSNGKARGSFLNMQDSIQKGRLMIDFAKSILGRNHFKNNYIRHSRVLDIFDITRLEAANLINEINRELKIEE
jgi:hypothetical protein